MDETQASEGLPTAKRRLGRGLSSLICGVPAELLEETPPVAQPANAEYIPLDVDAIERNPYQPRKEFDAESLNELVESIVQRGVLQPLLVRTTPGGYQLIVGERRLLAARKAGLRTVPCRVVELEDRAVCEVAIMENLQRADLSELEKAQAFHDYLERFLCTIEDLARKLGKDRSTISNALRLLELPDFVKLALQNGKITAGHARALLPLEEEADQIAMCQRIQSESLNVRQTEEQVRLKLQETVIPFERADHGKDQHHDKEPDRAGPGPVAHHIQSLQQQLRDLVGAKVEIRMKGKDAGRLIVHFSSNDEFERIVAVLRRAG